MDSPEGQEGIAHFLRVTPVGKLPTATFPSIVAFSGPGPLILETLDVLLADGADQLESPDDGLIKGGDGQTASLGHAELLLAATAAVRRSGSNPLDPTLWIPPSGSHLLDPTLWIPPSGSHP